MQIPCYHDSNSFLVASFDIKPLFTIITPLKGAIIHILLNTSYFNLTWPKFCFPSTFEILCNLKVGPDRRCNFAPWDSVSWSIVPSCPTVFRKWFQQCRISSKCSNSHSPSYPTLLEALSTPWDSVEQCSMGTLSLVPRSKVASSGPTLRKTPIVNRLTRCCCAHRKFFYDPFLL